ncbi:MAG: hypothetical protein WC441_01445 [Patescibacteria group bacterium]
MPPVKKTKDSNPKSSKSAPLASKKAKPKAAKRSKPKTKAEVEILKPIKPKKVAQAIAVEVAEDNFNASAFNDLLANPNYQAPEEENVNPPAIEMEEPLVADDKGLDKQDKFFTQLAQEIQTAKENPQEAGNEAAVAADKFVGETKHFKKSAGLYRRLVIKFVLAVAVLVLVVAYFSFSKLTLLITPKTEHVGTTLELAVYDPSAGEQNQASSTATLMKGRLKNLGVSAFKSYPAGGEEILGEEVAGRVTLINNYNKDQALVVKTRLLSPDGKLFRLQEAVNIPAGGKTEAAIYADEPSQEMAIAPTRFSIPGLWAGLQDKIYAESSEKFVYQHKIKKYIKPSDLELATKDMANHLLALAQGQAADEFNEDSIAVYSIDDSQATSTFDSKVGDYKDNFNLTATSSVTMVFFPKKEADELIKERLKLSVPDDKELISWDKDPVYTLEKYDPATKIATVKVELNGLMALKKDSELIDRSKLVNLNREQIKEYLDNFPEISSYELKLSPSFINKAPGLVDRIQIKIKAPQ